MPKTTPITNHVITCCSPAKPNSRYMYPNCTFLGGVSDQPFTAFFVWEKLFTEHAQKMKRFIEFGCDQGNTSVYFVLWCINLEAEYVGYDSRKRGLYKNSHVKRLVKLDKHMRLGNGFKMADEIKENIRQKGQSVIFTDCIDKPWEFQTFAPMLKRGDILAVHDWDRAIFDEWVKDTMEKIEPYELLYEKERRDLKTLTRFFRKL